MVVNKTYTGIASRHSDHKIVVSYELPKPDWGADQMNWGYFGTGPINTAHQLLLDHLVSKGMPNEEALGLLERDGMQLVYRFVQDFVSKFRIGSSWELTSEKIDFWMENLS